MQSNLLAQERLQALARTSEAPETVFANVNVVQLPQGTVLENAAVLIKGQRISWVGLESDLDPYTSAMRIDGKGGWLAPGLMDVHTHTYNDADYLLHLSVGVTTIREMNGRDWRVARRDAVDTGAMFAPNMSVVSQILNSSDFGGFAVPVNNPEEARIEVRKAAAMGYEAIKIHNGLANDVFHAIADEARSLDLELVGHIPVRVKVAEAIAAGMHTAEHFKGYIDDSNLLISDEDWVTASMGTDMYLTPTFYTYREHLRGNEARLIIDRDGPLMPPYRVQQWHRYVDIEADKITQLRQSIRPKSEEIFKRLLPLNLKWLVGTDSGGYDLMVPGLAVIEEMEIMEGLGLPALETLKAATTNAADALGWSDRTGRIAADLQADLILLRANPIDAISNLRALEGVMVRGHWIADPAGLRIPTSAYDGLTDNLSREKLQAAVVRAEVLQKKGYVPSSIDLEGWANLMESQNHDDLADRLLALRVRQ